MDELSVKRCRVKSNHVMLSSFRAPSWRKWTLSGAESSGGRNGRRCVWRLSGKSFSISIRQPTPVLAGKKGESKL